MSSQFSWIHCNKCYELFVHKRATFFLLSCSHIVCESCLFRFAPEDDQRYCPVCKRSIASKRICSEMNPKYKRYFDPKPSQNVVDFEVQSFQIFHFNNLCKAMCRADMYFEETKNGIQELSENIANTDKLFEELSQHMTKWEAKAAQYKYNNQKKYTNTRIL